MAIVKMTASQFEEKYGYAPFTKSAVINNDIEEEEQKNTLFSNPVTRLGKGVVKSVASSLQNTGKLVTDPLAKATGVDPESLGIPEEMLERRGTAEKVGGVIGDVAQFAIPGGLATKGITTATRALPTVAKVGSQMLGQGVVGGTVAVAQTGEVGKDARDTAILSALFPGAGAIANGAKVKIGTKAAPRIINSLIKPLKKDMSYGKNPGRAVSQEGIVASSLDDLESKISEKLNLRIGELENTLSKSKSTFDFTSALKPLDEAIEKAVKQNNSALVSRIEKTKQALTQNLVREIDEETGEAIIRSAGARKLDGLSAEGATAFKREIGEITAFTGNPSDDKLVNSALKKVYGNAKETINSKVPRAAELNERIADLMSARVATRYRGDLAERQNLIKFTPKVVGGVGLASSLLTGNPLPVIVGLGIAGFEKALETPKAKTALASWLVKSTPSQKNELYKAAPWVKGAIQKSLLGLE